MENNLDKTWKEMYKAARSIRGFHKISNHMEAGGVAATILSSSGKMYTGVCIDTACTLGVCAERNALFNMISNKEYSFTRVLALTPEGKCGAPCGACREFMMQMLEGKDQDVEVLVDYEKGIIQKLSSLTPDWWI